MKASTEKATDRFGLVANGSSGVWDISINETIRGKEKWYADIEGPSVYLSFQLIDLDILDKMIAFLDRRASADASPRKTRSSEVEKELVIGSFGQAPVSLIGDNEYEDRCFLVVGPKSGCCVRFPLWGEDTRMIFDALRQIREDVTS
jgi:hypothetical protein